MIKVYFNNKVSSLSNFTNSFTNNLLNYNLLNKEINNKYKLLLNALSILLDTWNTFITDKYPNEKSYIITILEKLTQETYDNSIIVDVDAILTQLETRLTALEEFQGFKCPTNISLYVNGGHRYKSGGWKGAWTIDYWNHTYVNSKDGTHDYWQLAGISANLPALYNNKLNLRCYKSLQSDTKTVTSNGSFTAGNASSYFYLTINY